MHISQIRVIQATSAAVIAVVIGWSGRAIAQCTKDVDCKGDRVCNNGVCVSPTSAVPSEAAVPSAPQVVPVPAAAPVVPAVTPAQTSAPAPYPIATPAQPVAPLAETPAVVAPTPALQPAATAAGSVSPGLTSASPPPSAAIQVGTTQSDSTDGKSLRIAGIVCASVGLASIATGVIFYIRARTYSDAQANEDRFNTSYDAIGKQAETLQWVFYAAGAAAVATGATMYWLGMPSTTRDGHANVEVSPMLRPGGGGFVASGTF